MLHANECAPGARLLPWNNLGGEGREGDPIRLSAQQAPGERNPCGVIRGRQFEGNPNGTQKQWNPSLPVAGRPGFPGTPSPSRRPAELWGRGLGDLGKKRRDEEKKKGKARGERKVFSII